MVFYSLHTGSKRLLQGLRLPHNIQEHHRAKKKLLFWGSLLPLALIPLVFLQPNPIINWLLLSYTALHILKLIDYRNRYDSLSDNHKNFWKFFHSFDHLYTTNVTRCLPRGTCTLTASTIQIKLLVAILHGVLGVVLLYVNSRLGWWQISPAVNYATLGAEYYLFFMCGTNLLLNIYRIIGYEVSEFFDAPAFATSPHSLWRRWNIPMHEWLRDNVYLQITGRKRLYTGIPLVFVASGLCHGYTVSLASCTTNGFMLIFFMIQSCVYVLSMLLHDLLSGHVTDYKRRKDLAVIKWALTMASVIVPGFLFVHNMDRVFLLHEFWILQYLPLR